MARIQGIPLPVSELETAILPARIEDYAPAALDELLGSAEVRWQGIQSLGRHDGQIALYLAPDFPLLGRISMFAPGAREQQIRELLLEEGSVRFDRIIARLGGFGDDLLRTLWKLVWNGEVTSDSLDALRARLSATAARYRRRPRPRYTTRKRVLPGAAGRWTLLSGPGAGFASEGERERGRARQLLERYGIVSRRIPVGDDIGFERAAPSLGDLVEAGRAELRDLLGVGEPQYLAPGAGAIWEQTVSDPAGGWLSACDPANPWGLVVPWPRMVCGYRPRRAPGARVLFHNGTLIGYLTGTGRGLHTPRGLGALSPLVALVKRATQGRPVFLETVDGEPPYRTPWHGELVDAGFSPSRHGYLLRTR